jgi:hypothetical protein
MEVTIMIAGLVITLCFVYMLFAFASTFLGIDLTPVTKWILGAMGILGFFYNTRN